MAEARDRFLRDPDDDRAVDRSAGSGLSITEALVAESLDAALGKRGLRRLRHEPGLAVVVEIPAGPWSSPTEAALGRLCPAADVVVVLGRRTSEFSENKAAKALGASKSVIAVTTSPSNLLPAGFVGSADLRIALAPPPAQAVRRIITATCTGSARSLRPGDLVGLGLHDIAYAIRPGAARAVIDRLRRAAYERSEASLAVVDAPPLEALAGYGAAQDWGLQVVADMKRWRAGEPVVFSSCLLAGPPGVGKTHFASSLARSAGLTLISASVAGWFAGGRGDLGDVIKAAIADFTRARESAPCLFFLDEADALPSRAQLSDRGRDWWTSVITAVLVQVDQIRRLGRPIVLLAATNYASHVDEALLRPGRLDHTITIDIPEGAVLEKVFRSVLGEDLGDVSLTPIIRRLRRATGAQVRAWVDTARRMATSESRALRLDDLIRSVLPVDDRPPDEMMAIAVHEAGHAVVALSLGSAVTEVSVIAEGNAGGATAVVGDGLQTRGRFEDQLTVMLGGRAADEIVGQGPSAGAVADLAAATMIATATRSRFGLHGRLLHLGAEAAEARLAMDREFADEVESDLQAGLARAKAIIEAHRDVVVRIAEALVTRKILDADDLQQIWRARHSIQTRRGPSIRRIKVRSGDCRPLGST
mgnify:CR=1 FL=1